MEKLNELGKWCQEVVKYWPAVAKLESFNYRLVRDAAEEFRALEQRASNLNDGWFNAIAERDEARAKLAEMAKRPPIGRVDRGEVSDNNEYPNARVVCLHDQADWENFQDGTELFLRPAPAADLADLLSRVVATGALTSPEHEAIEAECCSILRKIEEAK